MGRTQFAAASALLVVGTSLITAPDAGADPINTFTYTVSSDAALKDVSYTDAASNLQIVDSSPTPWSLTFTKPQGVGAALAVGGTTTGQQVSCQISVNGSVKDQKSLTGPNASVNCSSLLMS
jgi:hypothetical protein